MENVNAVLDFITDENSSILGFGLKSLFFFIIYFQKFFKIWKVLNQIIKIWLKRVPQMVIGVQWIWRIVLQILIMKFWIKLFRQLFQMIGKIKILPWLLIWDYWSKFHRELFNLNNFKLIFFFILFLSPTEQLILK